MMAKHKYTQTSNAPLIICKKCNSYISGNQLTITTVQKFGAMQIRLIIDQLTRISKLRFNKSYATERRCCFTKLIKYHGMNKNGLVLLYNDLFSTCKLQSYKKLLNLPHYIRIVILNFHLMCIANLNKDLEIVKSITVLQ